MDSKVNEISFWRSLAVQLRVIDALLRREFITRYGRYNIGFMWLFAEPMMFTIGVTVLWRYIHHAGHSTFHEVTIVSFVITGYSQVMLWRNATARCANAIEPNLGLLYHRNVRVLDLMWARIILEVAGATISVIVLSSVGIATGLMDPPADILMMAAGWLLLAWYAISVGLTVGALSEFSETFSRLYHVFMYLYLPLSGSLYMVEWLPGQVQKYALWLPTVNASEMIHGGYYGNAVHSYYNPMYLILVNLVLMLFGLSLINIASLRVEPQ